MSPGSTVTINSPSNMGPYTYVAAGFGPSLTKDAITKDIVLADDGDATSSGALVGSLTDACTSLVNSSEMNGKIAMIQREDVLLLTKLKMHNRLVLLQLLFQTETTAAVKRILKIHLLWEVLRLMGKLQYPPL